MYCVLFYKKSFKSLKIYCFTSVIYCNINMKNIECNLYLNKNHELVIMTTTSMSSSSVKTSRYWIYYALMKEDLRKI